MDENKVFEDESAPSTAKASDKLAYQKFRQ